MEAPHTPEYNLSRMRECCADTCMRCMQRGEERKRVYAKYVETPSRQLSTNALSEMLQPCLHIQAVHDLPLMPRSNMPGTRLRERRFFVASREASENHARRGDIPLFELWLSLRAMWRDAQQRWIRRLDVAQRI